MKLIPRNKEVRANIPVNKPEGRASCVIDVNVQFVFNSSASFFFFKDSSWKTLVLKEDSFTPRREKYLLSRVNFLPLLSVSIPLSPAPLFSILAWKWIEVIGPWRVRARTHARTKVEIWVATRPRKLLSFVSIASSFPFCRSASPSLHPPLSSTMV